MRATILELNNLRYDPDDFNDFLVDLEDLKVSKTVTSVEKETISSELILTQNAEPPAGKLDALLEGNEKFRLTWQSKRERDSFPSGDDSTSEYHMSLAYFAASANWTPQETAALIIAWNRRHNHNMGKVMRLDYMILTTEKARKKVAAENANKTIEHANILVGSPHENLLSRQERLAAVSQYLGVGIVKIIMFVEDEPRVLLKTTQGEILLPSVDHLIKPSKLQQYIATVALVYMKINKKKWPDIANMLLSLAEKEEVSEESTAIGRIKSLLLEYLRNRRKESLNDRIDQGTTNGMGFYPFVENGYWYISITNFHEFCHVYGGKETLKSMSLTLKRCGCENKSFNIMVDGKPSSRKAWKIPHNIEVP